jgi:Tfp pilus assembly protein PilF
MKRSVIFAGWFLVFLLASATLALGDTIHLKNGRTIWADAVRDLGGRIEYDLGEDTYAIPKSSVDHIDAGGVAPQFGGATSKGDLPAFSPQDDSKADPGLAEKFVENGAVNAEALSNIEKQGDPKLTSLAYYIAGKLEFESGHFPQSRGYFEKALHADPQNPTILNYYAAVLVRSGNASEGLNYAERAVRMAPNSPDALAVLGYAQYASDRTADAIATWKKSLQLRPDAALQAMLAKAERDATAEADFVQKESIHFTLRYEGRQTTESLRSQILGTLESEYDDLVVQLGVEPRASIPVILYTEQAYFDVTQAPSWSGAVNDGKLRIPIQGLSSVTSELARVLKHELAHSFINQLTGGRCPQWLNEGVAQAIEPKSLSSRGRQLAELFRSQNEMPLNALEGGFMRFNGAQALLAYDESLAAVLYITDAYGMSDVQRILQRLGEGSSTEAALRATIHSDYGQLQADLGKYLSDKYGE